MNTRNIRGRVGHDDGASESGLESIPRMGSFIIAFSITEAGSASSSFSTSVIFRFLDTGS